MPVSHGKSISIDGISSNSIYAESLEPNHDDHDCRKKFDRYKIDIYHVLERQEGNRTLIYHLFVFTLTLISLILGSISTIDEWRSSIDKPLYYIEFGLGLFFVAEIVVRIWSSSCRRKYCSFVGRLMFLSRPAVLIDLFTSFGFIVSLLTGINEGKFPSLTLKFLPPLQMIRFLRVDRQLSSLKILREIVETHRQELTVTLVIGFMFLITGSYLVHIAEIPIEQANYQGRFRSIADSMWFSIITVHLN